MIHDRAAVLLVAVNGAGVSTPEPAAVTEIERGERRVVEVGVQIDAPAMVGSSRPVMAVAHGHAGRWESPGQIRVAEAGWTMWMVSHFHYDPVWWNTQGQFTQTWPLLPPEDGRAPEVKTAFELVRLHLEAARNDPDYKFVLAEIDYLKPYFDAFPADRADLRDFITAGRIEIVGGSYNEPNTNLSCAESTIRNAVYGLAFQRGVLGASPTTTWMLDAFGFDPAYPGLMAAAGMSESSWARGPYHQWGPDRSGVGNAKMQFASEFEWLSPDGSGLLTSYMPNHYSAGWITQHAGDLATAERDAYVQFSQLAPVAATRNVLLPVGGDHVVPSVWATAIHRDWNARYVWPRFVTAVPSEFFEAVRSEAAASGAWFMPQTRDMNPVYPGKDVTYIDTKQAQRDAEIALLDGERLATVAWLAGAPYPAASLDKAWRLLAFGAHHDAITGTEGDQVYLDLLAGWREAFERGDLARKEAAGYIAAHADTASVAGQAQAGRAMVVFNTLSRPRSGLTTIAMEFAPGETETVVVRDDAGRNLPYLGEGVGRHPDGSLAAVTLTFLACDVPAFGYRTYLAVPATQGDGPEESGWADGTGTVIENDVFTVIASEHGGALRSLVDRRTGTELLAGPGNELTLQEEYATHPRWGEGPWLLCPKGGWRRSGDIPARITAQRCPIGSRLVAEYSFDQLRVVQETLLWDGSELVEFRTHVDGSIGQDRLLRVRFATNVPGGLPVFQTGLSAIGRPLGQAEIDVAEHTYTLDNPAHEWFGVGSTARVTVAGADTYDQAIGVAEVIAPSARTGRAARIRGQFPPREIDAGGGFRREVRDLVVALARVGVTATCTVPDGPRYGTSEVDSNLPDVRIALGGPADNAFTAAVLAAAGPGAAEALDKQLFSAGSARIWVPANLSRRQAFAAGADVSGVTDLPVLIVAGHNLGAEIAALIDDLADARVEAAPVAGAQETAIEPALAGHAVALLNRGLPGSLVTPTGDACISLMRACSSWPSGVWMDGDKRVVPDGSSFSWQHWSHTFEYALAAGDGDWRAAGFPAAGQEYNHRLLAFEAGLHGGQLPAAASLASVTPATADLMTLKPRGNPVAPAQQPDPADGVTMRLRDLGALGDTGQPVTVRLAGGISSAAVSDLLEQATAGPVRISDDAASVVVPQRGVLTLAIQPAWGGEFGALAPRTPRPAVTGVSPEPAQPVFTRYWLHGKGPAPAGNVPVAVHLSPSLLQLTAGQTGVLRVTVACGTSPAAGAVVMDLPAGLRLAQTRPAGGDARLAGPTDSATSLHYDLVARGYAAWDVCIQAPAGAPDGKHFVAARIIDEAGQLLEDAVAVYVGHLATAPSEPSLAELLPVIEAAAAAQEAEAELSAVTGDLDLPPGGQGQVTVRLANRTASELRGEAQLISPHGSWAALEAWTTGFRAPAGRSATLTFDVVIPRDARPGQRWWALVKVMYFGRLRYSAPVWINVIG